MTFPRFTFVRKEQTGFTLVELLVAIAIVGIITLGITMTISQIWTINIGASNHMIAVRQVQQAGKEVSKDTLQAQSVQPSGTWGFPLTLTWKDRDNANNVVVYTITEDDELERSHSVNGVTPPSRVIARYIHAAETSAEWNGKLVLTVTATVGNGPQQASETRVYEVEPRPTPPSS